MAEQQGSPPLAGVHRTAIGAATLRAFHLLQRGRAKKFCAMRSPCTLRTSLREEAVSRIGGIPAYSAGWVLRSRYAEDRLAAARAHLNQYVIPGACLKAYALRHAADLNEVIVFEVDDPAVQAWKTAQFRALGVETQGG